MKDSFYITLPSNVKNESYENTVANFKTQLAQRINLKGSWSVGLASISYTNSWYNLTETGYLNIIYSNGEPKKLLEVPIAIYPGRYDTIEDLITTINLKFKKLKDNFSELKFPELDYEKKSKIVTIKLGLFKNRLVYLEMSDNICKMLGIDKIKLDAKCGKQLIKYSSDLNSIKSELRSTYEPSEPDKKDLFYSGEQPYNLFSDNQSLFIYCDVVKHSFVGDTLSPLLRFVEIPPKYSYGEQIVCTYPDTHYIPLMTNEFESIEIAIRNDIGDLMPFEHGRSIVVLHFRKE